MEAARRAPLDAIINERAKKTRSKSNEIAKVKNRKECIEKHLEQIRHWELENEASLILIANWKDDEEHLKEKMGKLKDELFAAEEVKAEAQAAIANESQSLSFDMNAYEEGAEEDN